MTRGLMCFQVNFVNVVVVVAIAVAGVVVVFYS